MAGEAAAAIMAIQAAQTVLSMFDSTINFGSYYCPTDTPVEKIRSMGTFDFIIVGAGTAGCVLANRLSACPNVSVLLLEAGGCPPFESFYPGLFTLLPQSEYDYNMTTVNDHYTQQNLQGNSAGATAGKMLGGSSSLQHMLYVRGSPADYSCWASAANDSTWDYCGLLPYFKRSENVFKDSDEIVLKKYGPYHGTRGSSKVQRQHSDQNCQLFDAFAELNYTIRVDTNNYDPFGIDEPFLQIGEQFRQGGVTSYLFPVKNRPNLYVRSGATVTKINFNGNRATGVKFSINGRSYTVNSKYEVIVSAGAIKTPQLLMLSGVGPTEHLKSKNIPVVSDLPVGRNLMDHVSASMVFTLGNDPSVMQSSDLSKFPVPLSCSYTNLDDKCADFAQCQVINLIFPRGSAGFMQLCLNVFKYKLSICQGWFNANADQNILFAIPNILSPLSTGEVLLNTTNINNQPLIYLNYFSDKSDLVTLAKCLANTAMLVNTTYFKKVGSEFIDLEVCSEYEKYSSEYWECYGVAMSDTNWHFSGTACLGTVVDAKLRLKGVKGVRVIDASIIPQIPGGNINAAVLALAEKGADIIRAAYKKLFSCITCKC